MAILQYISIDYSKQGPENDRNKVEKSQDL